VKKAAITFRILAILAAAIGATALVHQARATVVWSFYETGISCFEGSCTLPPQPYVLVTLTLPGPTSTGTAIWQGDPRVPPVYTGDDFILNSPAGPELSPRFTGSFFCSSHGNICDFDIAWSATAGGLAIILNLDTVNDNIGGGAGGTFGPFGGPIASDGPGTLGGCVDTQCRVTGFWQSDLSLPEPMSAILLLTGLFGTWVTGRYRYAAARSRRT